MPTLRDEIEAALFAVLPRFKEGEPGYLINRDRDEVWWFDGVFKEPDRLVGGFSEINRCFRMVPQTPYRKDIGDRMAAQWGDPYKGRGWKKRLAQDFVAAIVKLNIQPSTGGPE